jgi:hypothetical protein
MVYQRISGCWSSGSLRMAWRTLSRSALGMVTVELPAGGMSSAKYSSGPVWRRVANSSARNVIRRRCGCSSRTACTVMVNWSQTSRVSVGAMTSAAALLSTLWVSCSNVE